MIARIWHGYTKPKHADAFSSAAGALAERGDQALAANFGEGYFDFWSLGGSNELLFEIYKAAFLVLANQFADILAGRTPVARSNLPFYILLEGFGEGDVQGGHRHTFII
jgi:hypothetical protein